MRPVRPEGAYSTLPDLTGFGVPFLEPGDRPPCVDQVAVFDDAARGNKPGPKSPDRPRPTPEVRAAQAICATCPAARGCLAYALEHNDPGVWGGTTEHQRRRIRTRLRQRRQGMAS